MKKDDYFALEWKAIVLRGNHGLGTGNHESDQ